MCDTLILRHQGQTWFAKNSDREPAEPQRLLRLPAVRNDPEARLRTTSTFPRPPSGMRW